jgi:hypothetical protein
MNFVRLTPSVLLTRYIDQRRRLLFLRVVLFVDNVVENKVVKVKGNSIQRLSDGDSFKGGGCTLYTSGGR